MAPPARKSSCLLKIFSGPNIGAEVPLQDGIYVLGSHDDCDLVLSDHFIAPRHAQFELSGGKVRCRPLDNSQVLVGGKPLDAAGQELANFVFVTLGTTHLAVGPSDKPWPVESFPDFQLNPTAADPAAETPAPEELKAPAPVIAAAPRRRGSIWPVATALLLLLFPALVIGALWKWQGEKQVDQPKVSQVGSILARYNKEGAVLKYRKHKEIDLVQGYVKTAETARKASLEFRKASPGMAVWIWDSESLAKGVRAVLTSMHVNMKAVPGGLGEVVITGDLPSEVTWDDVQARILKDLRPLRRLSIQSTASPGESVSFTATEPPLPDIPEDFSPKVLAEAQKPQVEKPVAVAVNSSEDQVQPGMEAPESPAESTATVPETAAVDSGTGESTPETPPEVGTSETSASVESPAVKAADKITAPPPTVAKATTAPAKVTAPPAKGAPAAPAAVPGAAAPVPEALKIELQSISVGANQTVTLPGGKKLFAGARLPGGHRIVAITPDGIMLEKNGIQRLYRLGGSP